MAYDNTRYLYDPKGGGIQPDVAGVALDRVHEAHIQLSATQAAAAAPAGVHAARTCPAVNFAAAAVVKAASAVTDTLTISETVALGEIANDLNVLLTTAENDTLAVTKTDETKTINIALADTTAAKNTAALIQAAIRALTTVGGISVAAVTCAAGGNWDTAAIATGEEEAVPFSGGLSPIDILTTGISNPPFPRNVTATVGGTAGDIKAVQVTVEGTNYLDEEISETLPAFTVDTPGIVAGALAFKTVSQISIPAHDGLGATTAIGFGDILGLPVKMPHNLVGDCFLNNVKEAAPAVAFSATAIESNTVDLVSALNGTVVDIYLKVY